jgi:hypothetical protein
MTIDKLLTQGGLGFVYKKRAVSIAYKTLVKSLSERFGLSDAASAASGCVRFEATNQEKWVDVFFT